MLRLSSFRLLLLAILAALCAGCGPANSPSGKGPAAEAKQPAAPLTVLVVDDPALGKAIAAEWRSRTDTEVTIRPITWKDAAAAQRLPGDLIVFPAGQLGELAEAALVAPISEQTLESEAFALRDIYRQIRLHEMKWGDKVYALPLGSPHLMLVYRRDIFERLKIEPPQTWEEYAAVATRLAKREDVGDLVPAKDAPWRGTVEPLGGGFAAQLLLARSAAYAAHREQVSPLFELASLRPLISEPPYVRALTELAAQPGGKDEKPLSPAQAYREILAGRCAMAITWPANVENAAKTGVQLPLGFAELPGSPDVYDFGRKKWNTRSGNEDPHVPLLAVSGRMVAVTATSSDHQEAENMAAWLASGEVATQVSPTTSATTLFRISQEPNVSNWLGPVDATAGKQYVQVLRQTQERPQRSQGVRLPGREEYLAALNAAVLEAAGGKKSPEDSLQSAAKAWEEITHRRGLEVQRKALERSLGLRRGDS